MKFYETPKTKCGMHILVYSMDTKATRRKAAVLLSTAVHSSSRGNLKNLMRIDPSLLCGSFTAAVPSTIITKRWVLRSTCKLQNRTSSMALATVNTHKIIKVTSAPSYVFEHKRTLAIGSAVWIYTIVPNSLKSSVSEKNSGRLSRLRLSI